MKIFTSDKSLGLFAIRGDLRNSFSNTLIFGLGGDFSCGIPSGIWKIFETHEEICQISHNLTAEEEDRVGRET